MCSVAVEGEHCQYRYRSAPVHPSSCVLCDVIWADSEILVTDSSTLSFHKPKF